MVGGSVCAVCHPSGKTWQSPYANQVPVKRAREVRRPPPPQEVDVETWSVLDEFNLSDVFLQRVPMLKKCPHFLRGRLRYSVSACRFARGPERSESR